MTTLECSLCGARIETDPEGILATVHLSECSVANGILRHDARTWVSENRDRVAKAKVIALIHEYVHA